jgi:hypothetical protein
MSQLSGTLRGTPNNRRQQAPQFNDSPSNIPRPKLDNVAAHSHNHGSEMSGTSTLSMNRQKQIKRDEVRIYPLPINTG